MIQDDDCGAFLGKRTGSHERGWTTAKQGRVISKSTLDQSCSKDLEILLVASQSCCIWKARELEYLFFCTHQ